MTASPASILIINIRLIGDVILTTPLVGILKNAFPDAAIDFLVNRGTGEFLEKDPRVRRVIYSEKGSVAAGGGREGGYFRDIFRRYDLAINMNASDRGSVAALLAGKKTRVGFTLGDNFGQALWKKMLFHRLIPLPCQNHVALLCKSVADALGLATDRLSASVHWDAADAERVRQVLEKAGLDGAYFVIHPFARWRYKLWTMEKFAELSDRVAERYGLRPVWTASPSTVEVSMVQQGAELCRHAPLVIKGEFSLNQMACLLSGASLYIGLDTAVTHMAAAAGIPLVALYGPTELNRWFPWDNQGPLEQVPPLSGGRIIVVRKEDRECVPCGEAGCEGRGEESACILEIEVDEVMGRVDQVVSARCADRESK